MSKRKVFLEKVRIKNFLSLRNVTLPLKPLTVLVGPNASGKSNVLNALSLLSWMMIDENTPPIEFIQDSLWAGETNHITFQLQFKAEDVLTVYDLVLKPEVDKLLFSEELSVNDVKIISIPNGKFKGTGEDDKNEATNASYKLTLGSTEVCEENTIIGGILKEFIGAWELYDFQPGRMRSLPEGLEQDKLLEPLKSADEESAQGELLRYLKHSDIGSVFSALSDKMAEALNMMFHLTLWNTLLSWYESAPERFNSVSESLATSTNIRIGYHSVDGKQRLCLLEGYKNPIPMERASEGTLRLIAYYILLNQPELPPLIAIEEPERNLHPGVLKEIAYVLERIAERTQVIITTHSSQLLDTFSSKSLSDSLGVLLLHNRPGLGTEVINVEEIRKDQNRKGLDGWVIDFGIGSAIFDSGLLQDLMEDEPACQP